jgi:hypothetical protein
MALAGSSAHASRELETKLIPSNAKTGRNRSAELLKCSFIFSQHLPASGGIAPPRWQQNGPTVQNVADKSIGTVRPMHIPPLGHTREPGSQQSRHANGRLVAFVDDRSRSAWHDRSASVENEQTGQGNGWRHSSLGRVANLERPDSYTGIGKNYSRKQQQSGCGNPSTHGVRLNGK